MNGKPRILSSLWVFTLAIALGSTLGPEPDLSWIGRAYAEDVTYTESGTADHPDVSLNNEITVSGKTDPVRLYQNAYGLNGANSDVSPERGGNASSILTGSILTDATSTTYEAKAYGGSGGYGTQDSSANGGMGGTASAGVNLIGTGDIFGTAIATGGAGGGGSGSGNGGAGGLATLDPIYGESTNGGTVNVSGTATNGYGGGASPDISGHSTGSGANGASITLNNVVNGNTTGSLSISQSAVAGSGGGVNYGSGDGGQAGSAASTLSYEKNASYLYMYTYAAGGSGGNASFDFYTHDGGNGADGQDGTATTEATNHGNGTYGRVRAQALAYGGRGGDSVYGSTGQAGAATATARATSDAGSLSYAEAAANATGGNGGWGINGTAGGAAKATAIGTTAAAFSGYAGGASSSAVGGNGGHAQENGGGAGGAGGAATAESTFTYTGSESADAGVSAGAQGGHGGQGRSLSGGAGGDATAIATGSALNGGLSVSSGASGGVGGYSYNGNHGQGGAALATSTGTAARGLVSSTATTYTGPSGTGPTAVVVAQAGAIIANGLTSVSVSGTNEGSVTKNLVDAQGKQAAAFGTVLPSQDSLAPLLASNSQVQAVFSQDSTVLGYGVLGRTAASISDITYHSSLTYSYNMAAISNPQHLVVGLLDSSFSGNDKGFHLDFQIWGGNPTPLLTLSFTNPSDALSFFNDRVLDLGLLTDLPDINSYGVLNLNFEYTLVAAEGASFNFNFIEGSASPVPVPASVLLLGSGLLGLAGWRRRRTNRS